MRTSRDKFPISKITPDSPDYPAGLKQLKDPPKQIFYRGKWNPTLFKKSLAVVGSRRMTSYGQRVLEMLIPFLVAEGVTIISGFMYGVDTKAHQECLDCGGKTIAILGGGLDVLYPPENEKLYLDIIGTKPTLPSLDREGRNLPCQGEMSEGQRGLIISEYPPDQQPQLWTFPQRNRIVAGLSSLGVLVVEAGEKSGSLITAELARKLKKPVFTVPGPITSSSSVGTNRLIKEGLAKMVLNANDILGKIPPLSRGGQEGFREGLRVGLESKILNLLSAEPLTLDEIALKLSINIIETSQTLTMMAIKNTVEEKNGKYYTS